MFLTTAQRVVRQVLRMRVGPALQTAWVLKVLLIQQAAMGRDSSGRLTQSSPAGVSMPLGPPRGAGPWGGAELQDWAGLGEGRAGVVPLLAWSARLQSGQQSTLLGFKWRPISQHFRTGSPYPTPSAVSPRA